MQDRIKAVCEELIQINKEIYEKCQVIVKHYMLLKDRFEQKYDKRDWYAATRIFTAEYATNIGTNEEVLERIIGYRLHQEDNLCNVYKFSIIKDTCNRSTKYIIISDGIVYNQWAEYYVDLDKIIEKCKQIEVDMGIKWYEEYKKSLELSEQEKQKEFEKQERKEYERLKLKYGNKGETNEDKKQI